MHLRGKIVSTSGTQVHIKQARKKFDFSFGGKKKGTDRFRVFKDVKKRGGRICKGRERERSEKGQNVLNVITRGEV